MPGSGPRWRAPVYRTPSGSLPPVYSVSLPVCSAGTRMHIPAFHLYSVSFKYLALEFIQGRLSYGICYGRMFFQCSAAYIITKTEIMSVCRITHVMFDIIYIHFVRADGSPTVLSKLLEQRQKGHLPITVSMCKLLSSFCWIQLILKEAMQSQSHNSSSSSSSSAV